MSGRPNQRSPKTGSTVFGCVLLRHIVLLGVLVCAWLCSLDEEDIPRNVEGFHAPLLKTCSTTVTGILVYWCRWSLHDCVLFGVLVFNCVAIRVADDPRKFGVSTQLC